MLVQKWRDGNPGSSELILRPDGSVYHLGILPQDIADTVIVVGDPERVGQISSRFDQITVQKHTREFAVHTGVRAGIGLTVLSTGIGVDNIDIVMNELDAAVNFDLTSRTVNREKRRLRIIRIGTSGSLQADLPVGTILVSKAALGMDGLPYHYELLQEPKDDQIIDEFIQHLQWNPKLSRPYLAWCDTQLREEVFGDLPMGLTLTANGFYGPQGRSLRLKARHENYLHKLSTFQSGGLRLTNIEMECAGLYALGGALGHSMITICVLLAERRKNAFISDPQIAIDRMIDGVLERLT